MHPVRAPAEPDWGWRSSIGSPAPITGDCNCPPTRRPACASSSGSPRSLGTIDRRSARRSGRNFQGAASLFRLFERTASFRGHVLLVVLRHHLGAPEHPPRSPPP